VLNLAKDDKNRLTGQQVNRLESPQPVSLLAFQPAALRPGSGMVDICPECGAAVIAENGCVTCHSCGWSKCVV